MNLTYNSNKEIHNQTIINNTSTYINLDNTIQHKIIMNKANEKSMYRKHILNGKKKFQYFPNTKQKNITDNVIYDTNNKTTANNN